MALGLVVELAGIAYLWDTRQPSPVTATDLLREYLISDSDDYRTRTSLQLPATAPGRQVQHLVRRL